MSLPNRLKESLQEKGREIEPPKDLKQKIMTQIQTTGGFARTMKKRLIAGIIAACFIIPTGVIAYQAYYADELYGSFENVKKHIGSATIEGYMLLNAKLSQAKGELGKEDYQEFRDLLKVITASKLEYGDVNGNIDYDQVSEEKVAEIKEAMRVVQPFFDRLNGQASSKDVLTIEEYDQYIESLMTYEKIKVQSGINSSKRFEIEEIKSELMQEFLIAREFMEYVNEKQMDTTKDSFNTFPTFIINDKHVQLDYGLPSAHSTTKNMSDDEMVKRFSTYLTPFEVKTGSTLSITFDKDPNALEIQIWRNEKIISNTDSGTIHLPKESGIYTLLVKGEWSEGNPPYVFRVKVK